MPTSPQPGDTTVISTVSLQNGVNLPVARGGDISDAWINTANHTTRDALLSNITTLGTLVRTLNDGIVWEVTSVGPVVYTAWSGSGGVTSFNSRTGAVVPVSGDYAASGVTNDSSVTGTGVKGALNALLASIGAISSTIAGLVTGVSSVFGRAGAVVATVGDYVASQVTNDSTVAGTRVSDALNTLKALVTITVNKVVSTLSDVQSATTIIASPATGPQYTAKAYIEILVAGIVGKLIVNEIHTGPSGTVLTTPITAPVDITTVGNAGQGVVTLAVNGTSAVQYSVTSAPGTFTKGSLSYKLLISITPEPV